MKKRQKETPEEIAQQIRNSFSHWEEVNEKGTQDPFFPDGINLNLIRNHIIYDQDRLKKLCKAQKIRPCLPEAKLKLPRKKKEWYMAPGSKAAIHSDDYEKYVKMNKR